MGLFDRLRELKNFDEAILKKKQLIVEAEGKINEKQTELNGLIETKTAELNLINDTIDNRDKIIQEIKTEREDTIRKYEARIKELEEFKNNEQAEYKLIFDKLDKEKKAVDTEKYKLKMIRDLLKKVDLDGTDFRTIANIEHLAPTVQLDTNSFNVPSLRKLSKEVNKQIQDILKHYEGRYTTKVNQTIYKLLVLGLMAEIQNILISLKYSNLDEIKNNLTLMLNKYLDITLDGNQSIAPTIRKFIAQMDTLFNSLIDIEFSYYHKKQQEKEEQQALREQMKQEAEEKRALELERKKVEKEEEKYITEITKVEEQIKECVDDERLIALQERILELQGQLNRVEEKKEEISKLQNGKAGVVYIISNLGSFGENTFKVGMTRRMEPMDRVKELGDASVPFSFDVHSFIFSDNAVALENELHKRLVNKRKNRVNARKEFFDVTIEELETLVQEINPTAEFRKTMIATEYRQGLKEKEQAECLI